MNWDDLRFVVTLAETGSLLKSARTLGVDHTTVGRRIGSAETALGLHLFTRSATGYALTADGLKLVAPLRQVEAAVQALERGVKAQSSSLEGTLRITAPESFGVSYLASRLARFGELHPSLRVELDPSGVVRNLARGEAEVAIRFFRTKSEGTTSRKVGEVRYGLYAASTYLARHPVRSAIRWASHQLLLPTEGAELAWAKALTGNHPPVFVSPVSLVLAEAARAGAGIAVLPRYLGASTPGLVHLAMRNEPVDTLWLTVHQDLRQVPRVRAGIEFLAQTFQSDLQLLAP